MVTSRSGESSESWIGGAFLFSGRPDPTWPVDEQVAGKLLAIWEGLEPWPGELPARPSLGYRGCFLRNDIGQAWFAYRGSVVLQMAEGSQSRSDPGRSFEKQLLASAPEGTLPGNLIRDD